MLQRIKNVLEVIGKGCYKVSGTSRKLLQKDVRTYQEHRGPCLRNMFQPGTFWPWHPEDVTTSQKHLGPYIRKMLQRIVALYHVPTALTCCLPATLAETKILIIKQ